MPRTARQLIDGHTYHVMNRSVGGHTLFKKEQDYRVFINLLRKGKEKYPIKIFAYCLMPNHYHLVVQLINADNLSRLLRWLMTTHARRYHQHYQSCGRLWQGRYKSFIIQEDHHLLTVLRYVEGNPVRAGLASSAKDWPWSSHRERVALDMGLIAEVPVDLPEDWTGYVNEPLTAKEFERLRSSVVHQLPYGSTKWRSELSLRRMPFSSL